MRRLEHMYVNVLSLHTPIGNLMRTRRAIVEAAETFPEDDDALLERLFFERADAIEAEIMALPCESPEDFMAKAFIATSYGTLPPSCDALSSACVDGARMQEGRA